MRIIRDNLGQPWALEHEGRRLAVTRRAVLMGAGAAGALTLINLPLKRASAATDVFFLGWQGYDDPYKVGGFLEENGITLQTTYINTIEDIITKLRSGGMGSVDLTTLISQYVEFSAEAGLLEPIDESKVPNLGKRHPRFKQIDEILRVDGKLYGVPFTFSSPLKVEFAPKKDSIFSGSLENITTSPEGIFGDLHSSPSPIFHNARGGPSISRWNPRTRRFLPASPSRPP